MATRPRGRPPKGDPDSISDATILDAALNAFAERGFAGTSMREVARELGISHNLIPQRLGSKEQVWYAPQAKQLVKRIRERTAAHYEGKGKDTWELVQYTLK